MHLLRHDRLDPILLINGNIDEITKQIFKTYKRRFYVSSEDTCNLDPGSMYFLKISKIRFEIDGFKFEIQISKAETILFLLGEAKEIAPGYKGFPTFHYFVILSTKLFNNLKIKLKELEFSDESLHAELYEKEVRDDLVKKGFIC